LFLAVGLELFWPLRLLLRGVAFALARVPLVVAALALDRLASAVGLRTLASSGVLCLLTRVLALEFPPALYWK
jgi:hypothetical protein